MTFTQVFGGTTIYPSGVSYRAVALSANQTLAWPVETATSGNVVAQIMDVTPSAGSLSIIMPPANEVSVGETTLFFNPGAFTFTVKDNGGNTIVSIAPGLSYQVYLIGNSTVNGTWRSTQYAAGTSSATAGSLVGSGIKAINTTLNQSMSVTTLNSNYAIGDADRSEAFVWTGGAGAFTLPSSGTVGNDWFCQIRNGGSGAITLTPTGSELINGTSSLTFNPGDSAIVICDGSAFFTIGFGQSVAFAFDYVSIDLSSPVTSPYTLSGANLNRIAYSFGGTLTANMQVLIPATIQQYWISNDTSGAFSLTVKVSGQTGVIVPQGARGIYYCNGTDIIDADTSSFAFPVTVAQGGTGATTESGARINLGGTSVGIGVFTAATTADGRNALSAAKSGANSDITSLTGLTTPLSVGQGGTGVATLTANGVVVGNGGSALSATAVGTTGQVLVGNTGAAPSWATLTGIGVTSFSAGTTGLTPSTATTGVVTLAGTLGVANGGTGTATAFTAGSVVFAGASGVYSQDNANLFWDNTNDRLGIGTTTPVFKLSVDNGIQNITRYSAQGSLLLRAAAGTQASPTQITAGSSLLGNVVGQGYDGSAYQSTAEVRFYSDATVGSASSPGFLTFLTTASGSTTTTERMRITSAGDVGIGTSTPGSKLEVYGGVVGTTAGNEISIANDRGVAGSNSVQLLSRLIRASAGTDWTTTTMRLQGRVDVSNYGYIDFVSGGDQGLAFGSNAAETMRINASGNVGIGGISPTAKLDVLGEIVGRTNASGGNTPLIAKNDSSASNTTKSTGIQFQGVDTVGVTKSIGYVQCAPVDVNYVSSYLAFQTRLADATSEKMRLDENGRLGVGTSSPGALLQLNKATGAADLRMSVGGTLYANIYASASDVNVLSITAIPLIFGTNNTERARIDTSGAFFVGTTGGNVGYGGGSGFGVESIGQIHSAVSGATDCQYMQKDNTGGAYLKFFYGALNVAPSTVGDITTNGTGASYNTSSDYRLKDIDGPIANSGAYIDALKPVQGSWKADGSRFIGLLAHEVQEVSETPIATGEKDGEEMQSMDYSAPELITNLIAEIQSLRARVAQLEGN
jgi:hypothetical protein